MPHQYILVSHLPPGWSAQERKTAWDGLRNGLGQHNHPNPSHNTHYRISLDSEAVIVELDGEISRALVVSAIATALNVNPKAVEARISYTVLGGENATYQESQQAALAYIAANSAVWELDV